MYERHENEQYFFDEPTLRHLASYLGGWARPCCLCAPLLGSRLAEQGTEVRVLDVDRRFEKVPGFRYFDVQRPEWTGEAYDVVFCDPPFYNVSLSRLFAAIRLLARHDFRQKVLMSYLWRRRHAVLGTFAPFGLAATGYRPGYQTVEASERNEIELFSNLSEEELAPLLSGR